MTRNILVVACLLLAAQQAWSQTVQRSFCRDRTSGGTGRGEKCANSWSYRGITYNGVCTRANHNGFWCSTREGDYLTTGRLWGNCEASTCTAFCTGQTSGGTGRGAKCVFPFRYLGQTINSCTTFRHNRFWCSMNSTYIGMWGNCDYSENCRPNYCQDRTAGGPGEGLPCALSFFYRGVLYDQCTTANHNRLWCSMNSTYTGLWGNCLPNDCKMQCLDRTVGGTGGGRPCVFPFRYRGKSYNRCTTARYGERFWCSMDADYRGRWGACVYDC